MQFCLGDQVACPSATHRYALQEGRFCCSFYNRAPGCPSGSPGTPLLISDHVDCCDVSNRTVCIGSSDQWGTCFTSNFHFMYNFILFEMLSMLTDCSKETPTVVSDDNHLVYLSSLVPGRDQYINAVWCPVLLFLYFRVL